MSDEAAFMMHTIPGRRELTEKDAQTIAKATIAKIKEQQRTEVTVLTELLTDIVRKATPYGTQDGDFIASYILPTGPIHRAIAYLREHGVVTEEIGE